MNEWISVEDRLPDVPKDDYMSDYVLAYDKKAGIWVAFFVLAAIGMKQGNAGLLKMSPIGCRSQSHRRRSDTWQHPRSVVVADRR